MLELVDTTKKLDKAAYKRVFPELELRAAQCQRRARAEGVPVVVVFEGWDAAGKGSLINRLAQVLDPRGFKVHPINAPSEEEQLRPWMWRYWCDLPRRGTIAIFDRSWYGRVLIGRMTRNVAKPELAQAFDDILCFERQLVDDGAVLVKFWLHIDRKTQRKRFDKLEKDDATAWKVGDAEWRQNKHYGKWCRAVEEMLELSSTPSAPWTVVEAVDARLARVKVFETLVQAVEMELSRRASRAQRKPEPARSPAPARPAKRTLLDRLDLDRKLDRSDYEEQLASLQERLFRLEHKLYVSRIPAVIVYSGVDAAGKGGSIRRLTQGLDPRGYEVVPIMAPTPDELEHHYLWRFWTRLPKAGHITIFDRSWYGRVLVERVEGFCTEEEWQRAYREINEFERQLTQFGTVLVKFWLHIDRAEQLRRFKARQTTPHKQWKITDEDWRNRKKWPQYKTAIVDMLQQTSTTYAPWTIIEANDKLYARIKALSTVADALDVALKR